MLNDDEKKALYFAGLFDGEGCITILKQKSTGDNPDYLVPYVRLEMTNREVLEMFSETFGGNIHTHMPRKSNHKVSYSHASSGKRAKLILDKISPYLKVKKSQAEVALKLIKMKAIKNVPYEKMLDLRLGIQALNHA